METRKIKYPRTYHLPWSESITSDDKKIKSINQFIGFNVIITEKRDGENTTFSKDFIHARSLDSKNHESRDWVKQLWSNIKHEIPLGMRICGENLFAQHSIEYNNLNSYFEVFSIWIDETCLSWDETVEWCELFGLTHVPILVRGYFNENIFPTINSNIQEGYVIRKTDSFHYDDFKTSVAKFVRKNHVQTDKHWMNKSVIKNKLTLTEL